MATATITNTTYGYNAVTGTDKTAVTTDTVTLLGVNVLGTAGNETVLITDTAENVLIKAVAVANKTEYWNTFGARIKGLKVTLSAGTVSANFFVA